MEKEKELNPFKWQGPDGAIHTVSVNGQKAQAEAIATHNDYYSGDNARSPALHSTPEIGH